MIDLTDRGPVLDVDGRFTHDGLIELYGKATRQPNGKWVCLANVDCNLCVIEVSITFGDQEMYVEKS